MANLRQYLGWLVMVLSCSCATSFEINSVDSYVRARQNEQSLSDDQLLELSSKSDQNVFENDLLEPIMRVRVPGTPEHAAVRQHLVNYMENLDWNVEQDEFTDNTPNGVKTFTNVIATQNIEAPQRLTLACHYDSKYFTEFEFIGMTDSAVPCAMLLDLGRVLRDYIDNQGNMENGVSLQFIFFDGEEAFHHWTDHDSLYGARHLASQMQRTRRQVRRELTLTDLERMDMLILLDLIGAPNPTFKNWFQNTDASFKSMQNLERRLIGLQQFTGVSSSSNRRNTYFVGNLQHFQGIQDDHVPFLQKGVPIVHLISHPFPSVWHNAQDNADAFDYASVDNINKVLRAFVAQYLHLFS